MKEPTGKLSLQFRKKSDGKTHLARQYFKLPLQIMTTHYQEEDGTAFVYLLNPSGGILQHDRLLTEITLEKGSRSLITTPSSTKFYKMDEGYARVKNCFTLERDAVLEYLPEYNVPFAQSKTYQENDFYLDRNSVLIASDLVAAGRVSRGEIFDYDLYSSRTRIYVDGRLRLYDNSCIEPKTMDLNALGMMEGYLTNGTVYVHAPHLSSDLSSRLKEAVSGGDVCFAAGKIDENLMVIRLLGNSMIVLQEAVLSVWNVLRQDILGKNAVKIRKY